MATFSRSLYQAYRFQLLIARTHTGVISSTIYTWLTVCVSVCTHNESYLNAWFNQYDVKPVCCMLLYVVSANMSNHSALWKSILTPVEEKACIHSSPFICPINHVVLFAFSLLCLANASTPHLRCCSGLTGDINELVVFQYQCCQYIARLPFLLRLLQHWYEASDQLPGQSLTPTSQTRYQIPAHSVWEQDQGLAEITTGEMKRQRVKRNQTE